jgi:hypothetical protein
VEVNHQKSLDVDAVVCSFRKVILIKGDTYLSQSQLLAAQLQRFSSAAPLRKSTANRRAELGIEGNNVQTGQRDSSRPSTVSESSGLCRE